MSSTTYFAPTQSEYRTLDVHQVVDGEVGLGFGEAGEWYYCWRGFFEVGGFATEAAARAAGLAWGGERWPGLTVATGSENAYAAIKVHDNTGI